MLYRAKPPTINAYQFHLDWENDVENWPEWLRHIYEIGKLIKVNDSRVLAVIDNKAIFVNDYVYILEEGIKVVPDNVFEIIYEAAI